MPNNVNTPSPRPAPSGRAIGRAGNYAAPVDTAGMDSDMQSTLSQAYQPQVAPHFSFMDAFSKLFGGGPKKIASAADKSASVKRTSDIPVMKKGQGIQGLRHTTGTNDAGSTTGY